MNSVSVSSAVESLKRGLPRASLLIDGEAVGVHLHNSGHLYFDLKDSAALLKVAFYNYQGPVIKSGTNVIVSARYDIFSRRGQLQLIATQLSVKNDERGASVSQRALVLDRLQAAGHLDFIKQPLPKIPKLLVLVTARNSAACADMLAEAYSRFEGIRITIVPVTVQGMESSKSIVSGLKMAQALLPSVIVLARGGGSAEDLIVFDDIDVCCALAEARKVCPVVSAIGHEIDHPLTDLVADVRCKTPTAAIQMSVPDLAQVTHELNRASSSLKTSALGKAREALDKVERFQRSMASSMLRVNFLKDSSAKAMELARHASLSQMAKKQMHVKQMKRQIGSAASWRIETLQHCLGIVFLQLKDAFNRRAEAGKAAISFYFSSISNAAETQLERRTRSVHCHHHETIKKSASLLSEFNMKLENHRQSIKVTPKTRLERLQLICEQTSGGLPHMSLKRGFCSLYGCEEPTGVAKRLKTKAEASRCNHFAAVFSDGVFHFQPE